MEGSAALKWHADNAIQTADYDGSPRLLPARINAAAWHLASVSQRLGNDKLAAFAGEMLALVGTLGPERVAVAAPGMTPGIWRGVKSWFGEAPVMYQSGAISGSKASAKATAVAKSVGLSAVLEAALLMLADFLIDRDVHVIKAAQITLRHLLSTKDGKSALDALSLEQRAYVVVFHTGLHLAAVPGRTSGPPTPGAAGARWNLANDKIWETAGRSYEAWACELTFALLLHVQNPMLRVFHQMVRYKAAFAELIFNHVLADLAGGGADQETFHVLSAKVSQFLLHPTGTPHNAVRLLLGGLEFLRSLRLDALTGTRSAGAPPSDKSHPLKWDRVSWLNVGYLDIASAALQCGACFTALLYIEAWCGSRPWL